MVESNKQMQDRFKEFRLLEAFEKDLLGRRRTTFSNPNSRSNGRNIHECL